MSGTPAGAEAALAFVATHTGDIVVQADLDGTLTYVSPAAARYGYDASELIGWPISALVHPDDLPEVAAKTAHLLKSPGASPPRLEVRLRDTQGAWIWFESNPGLVPGPDGRAMAVINVFRDTTARRALEAAAEAQAKQFEAAFSNAPDGMALVDMEGRLFKVNGALRRITGFDEGELIGQHIWSLNHPDDVEVGRGLLADLMSGALDSYRTEKRYLRRDGAEIWMGLSVALVRDAEGAPAHFVVQMQDQTERRATEKALRDRESQLRLITESMDDVIVRTDTQGIVTYVSPSAARYGYEPDAVLGTLASDIIHPEDYPRMLTNLVTLVANNSAAGLDRQVRYRTADGAWIWMEGNPKIERNAAGEPTGLVNVLRNVMDRREQEDLFEAAFERSSIGKAVVTLRGRVLKANQAVCDMLGYEPDDINTVTVRDLTHPDEIGLANEKDARLEAGEIDSYTVERRYRRKDGNYIWVHLVVSVIRHPDGSPKHRVVELQDLTEARATQAALRESEARYRLIAENTSDMIVMSDLHGKTLYVSPSVHRQGVTPDSLEGRSFVESVHPEDQAKVFRVFREVAQTGEDARVRWRAASPAREGWTWYESNPSLVRDPETGRATGYIDVIREISRQVDQEGAIARAHAEAEAAAAAKSQFLANMSHEIRTPLTAVLGFTNLLSDMPLPDLASAHVRRIAGAGAALLAIVNDILDFSKLEAGKFEIRPRPTSITQVCEETLTLFTTQASAKGLALDLAVGEEPGVALIDADRLRQLLINLIGNAVKFTEVGGVALRVTRKAGGESVVFEVADSGPGLDAEAQSLLFQRFTQIDGSTTRRHGGTGLGLAISRGIAEAMGGTIGVTSAPVEGATFHVEIPAPLAEAEHAPDEAGPTLDVEGARVLVVDDNAVNRELTRRLLGAAGAVVSDAADGGEALERLATEAFDIVLMDLRMPVMDGRATLAALRASQGLNLVTPVYAFTADADLQDGIQGFDGLVRKPIQPLELFAAVSEARLQRREHDARAVA